MGTHSGAQPRNFCNPVSARAALPSLGPRASRVPRVKHARQPALPMEWYYAAGNERKGPVSDAEIDRLIAASTIVPDTLVWNTTMTGWQTAGGAGLFADGRGGANTRLCLVTGKTFPTSQMIETEHGWVSAEGRDTYYQCLREGVPFPAATGITNARADGKRIVVPARDARLPLRCVKTNQPVTEADLKKKTLWWCHWLVLLSVFLNLLVMLVLYVIFRKSVKLEIPLSKEGRRKVNTHVLIACVLCLGGLALVIVGVVNSDRPSGGFIVAGVLGIIGGAILGALKGSILRVVKYTGGEAWLAGAHPEFVASLPPYRR